MTDDERRAGNGTSRHAKRPVSGRVIGVVCGWWPLSWTTGTTPAAIRRRSVGALRRSSSAASATDNSSVLGKAHRLGCCTILL